MKKAIKVKPNSTQQKVMLADDGSLIVWLKSPPIDGKANTELITILAQYFNVPKAAITIKSGHSSKQKLVEIDN
ncbi:MAG: DUF167 domain-containing protein [Pseudanabaenaceae cyanobacterium]|jgi:uncharacterized protein (TIGR00251 family)